MKRLFCFLSKLLAAIIGHISWTAPAWASGIHYSIRKHPWLYLFVVALMSIGTASYYYYLSLPKPVTIIAIAQAPTPADISSADNATPTNLTISFKYDFTQLKKGQQRPSGNPSVARIDLVGEKVTEGIQMEPKLAGTWRWLNDRQLSFTPEQHWPPGTQYTVSFQSSLFATDTQLTSDTETFITPAMDVSIADLTFYQDPSDSSIRKTVATLYFSHPVDKESLDKTIALSMRPSGAGIETAKQAVN